MLEADTINNSRSPEIWHIGHHSLNPRKCSKCYDQPTLHVCFVEKWIDYEEIPICGYQYQIYDRSHCSDKSNHIAIEGDAEKPPKRSNKLTGRKLHGISDEQENRRVEIESHLVYD